MATAARFRKGEAVTLTLRDSMRFSADIETVRRDGTYVVKVRFALDRDGTEMAGTYVGETRAALAEMLSPFVKSARQIAEEGVRADLERMRAAGPALLVALEAAEARDEAAHPFDDLEALATDPETRMQYLGERDRRYRQREAIAQARGRA